MYLPGLVDLDLMALHGSLGGASRASGRSKAAMSRRLADLESALGVRLLERGGRGLRLTEAGRDLHARTHGPLGEIAEAAGHVGASDGRLRGRLRISAAAVFAHAHLVRIAAAFAAVHPEVELDLVAEDRLVDPVEEEVDIVIRANPPADDLVGRCLFRTTRVAVAAPAVARPADDEAARLLCRSGEAPAPAWTLREGGAVWTCRLRPAMRLSTLMMVREAVLRGAGVALLPRTLVEGDLAAGHLAEWGALDGTLTEVWALHTSRRLASGKVRAFLACLDEAFPPAGLRGQAGG